MIKECSYKYCEGCFTGKYPLAVPKQHSKNQERFKFNITE